MSKLKQDSLLIEKYKLAGVIALDIKNDFYSKINSHSIAIKDMIEEILIDKSPSNEYTIPASIYQTYKFNNGEMKSSAVLPSSEIHSYADDFRIATNYLKGKIPSGRAAYPIINIQDLPHGVKYQHYPSIQAISDASILRKGWLPFINGHQSEIKSKVFLPFPLENFQRKLWYLDEDWFVVNAMEIIPGQELNQLHFLFIPRKISIINLIDGIYRSNNGVKELLDRFSDIYKLTLYGLYLVLNEYEVDIISSEWRTNCIKEQEQLSAHVHLYIKINNKLSYDNLVECMLERGGYTNAG